MDRMPQVRQHPLMEGYVVDGSSNGVSLLLASYAVSEQQIIYIVQSALLKCITY